MDDEHDEILRLAEDFCDEDFAEDESFVMKSFAPEQAEEIKEALEILGKYKENYPDEVKAALQTLAELAVSAPEDQEDKDEEDDEDEDDDKKRVKKKGSKWSFSFGGVIDEDDDPLTFEKGSDVEELVEEIAQNYEILDDLLRTSLLLGREVGKQQKDEKISEKIDALNTLIERIAQKKGLKKSSGDNDNDKKWGFSLVRHSAPDQDDE